MLRLYVMRKICRRNSFFQDYGVYLEDNGHTLRGLFIIDDKGVLRQITMNDLPVGRSVDETLRLVQVIIDTNAYDKESS